MRKGQRASFRAILATAIGAGLLSGLAERSRLIEPAQAQSEAEKRKQEQEKQKAAPPRPQPPPPPKAPPAAPKVTTPPPPKVPPQQPPPDRPAKAFQQPPPERPAKAFQQPPPERPAKPLQQPPGAKPLPPRPAATPPPEPKTEGVKRLPPPGQQPPPTTLQKVPSPTHQPPTTLQKAPPPTLQKAPPASGPATLAPGPQPGPGGPVLKRFEEVRKGRIERFEDGGRRKVIEEPGNRVIIKQDNRVVVRSNESERFLRRPGAKSERRSDGSVETFYVRRDGVRIVTVVDAHGRLLRRYRRDRDGRERNIIDNRRFYRNVAIGVGIGALGIIALNLPPPRVTIPHDRYIVDYDSASDDDLYEALDAPPIELLDRAYSLEEIRDNYELRARVRSVDIDTINFDFGSWEIPGDQHWKLERIARAILKVLERNPDAVFLIAGFTDAVGSDEDNASLSDRRAAAVAEVLSDQFGVPEENLVTQGYGEQHLKVDTQGPEPRNRRVSVQNITGLMAER